MATIFGFDAQTLSTFDAAYWASQPPQVQALNLMDASQQARSDTAYKLAGQGFFIDVPVMVWGWDPYMTMYQREIDGYTTYPDGLNGQTRPVTTNPADFPPYVAPAPTTAPLVGPQIGMSPYFFLTQAAVDAHLQGGTEEQQDGHIYVLENIVQQNPSGSTSQVIQRWVRVS